jgi:hypothetical protein
MKNPVDIRFIVPDGAGSYCFADPEERAELAGRSMRQFLAFFGIYQIVLLLNQWLFDEVSPFARFVGYWIPSLSQAEDLLGIDRPLVPNQIAIAFILCVFFPLYWVALEDSPYERLKMLEKLRPSTFGFVGRVLGGLCIMLLCVGVWWIVWTPFGIQENNTSTGAVFFRDMLSGFLGLATYGSIVSYALAVVFASGLLMARLLFDMILEAFGSP